MDKFLKVINSWWFTSAIAGGVSIYLGATGSPLLCGIAAGVGAKIFLDRVRKQFGYGKKKECENCENCICK